MQIEKELADAKILESEAKVSQAQIDSAVRLEEVNTSHFNHAVDAAAKMSEIQSREHEQKINEHSAGLAARKLEHEIGEATNGNKVQTNNQRDND